MKYLLDTNICIYLIKKKPVQVPRRLQQAGLTSAFHDDMRITDNAAMEHVKDAAGSLRAQIEALLSMGLPNSPMQGARMRVCSGNFVTARPIGVVDGQENPVGVLVPVQIWQYHKYATFWNYLVDPVIIYWNKKQWNKFPPDIQKAIKDSAEEAGIFEKALCRAGLDGDKSLNLLKDKFNHTMEVPEPVKFMESKGMTVTFLTDDQRNAFIEATKRLYEK